MKSEIRILKRLSGEYIDYFEPWSYIIYFA